MTILRNEIEENYVSIKEKICDFTISQAELNILKTKFSGVINSKRRFSEINNLRSLIAILERRRCLYPVKIEPFYDFCEAIGDEKLFTLINRHQKLIYKWNQQDPVTVEPEPCNIFSGLDFLSHDIPVKLPHEVVSFLTSEMSDSMYWQDFARRLSIKESEIDDLDESNLTRSERILAILQKFESRANLFTHRSCLLEALTRIRRDDLRRRVEQIFQNHHAPLGSHMI